MDSWACELEITNKIISASIYAQMREEAGENTSFILKNNHAPKS